MNMNYILKHIPKRYHYCIGYCVGKIEGLVRWI